MIQTTVVKETRVIYLDYLRVAATFAVIVLHISGQNWYSTNVNSFEWQVLNFYDSIVRWVVPIFVMISGALFLDTNKQINTKDLYKKYIFKIFTALLFWSAVYALDEGFQTASFMSFMVNIIDVNYHLWFLLMLIGLYITIPILRKITASLILTKYFLIISLIFSFLIPRFLHLVELLKIPITADFISAFNESFSEMNFYLTLGYVPYFILGYYLSQVNITIRARKLIYLIGLLGFIATILLSAGISLKLQSAYGEFYSNFSINVLLMSTMVFVFGRYELTKITISSNFKNLILKTSKYSFGIYLVHALIIEIMVVILGISNLSFNPLISIPVLSIGVFAVSLIISFVLNKIPVAKKYIV